MNVLLLPVVDREDGKEKALAFEERRMAINRMLSFEKKWHQSRAFSFFAKNNFIQDPPS
ncbi:hypothetical protein [Marinimicrobium agarilyticum]|uniref:hypothetical protein n=1 Tax=Marinimicrobium agarilyticum TaxID=306546 RepID=UPI00146D5326|nr:hypothetical protein [Marinimicrobium agarilyticum]